MNSNTICKLLLWFLNWCYLQIFTVVFVFQMLQLNRCCRSYRNFSFRFLSSKNVHILTKSNNSPKGEVLNAKGCLDIVENLKRQYSSGKKRNFGGVFAVIVPLSALGFSLWAFVFGGISIKRVPPTEQMPIPAEDEVPYVSKVETLHRERQARQYLALQKQKEAAKNT